MAHRDGLTAIVLAGGLGTRLRPVVVDQPKVLADVGGHPFLNYLLDQLVEWRIQEVVLCTGHLGEQIEARFGPDYRGLRLRYSRESTPSRYRWRAAAGAALDPVGHRAGVERRFLLWG